MRSWIGTKKRSYLVAAFALLAAIAAIFIQTTASRAVQAPTNVTVATIAGPTGTFSIAQGKTLTVTPGTWTDSPTSTTYQWYRCTSQIAATSIDPTNCQIIDGETATTHLNSVSDVGFYMTVKETVTNAMGSASYYSAATTQVRQSNVIAMSFGSTCIIQSGRLYCAGANGYTNYQGYNAGILGIGTIGTKQTSYQGPLTTADGTVLTDIVSVSSTLSETCVINLVGNVYCFGGNSSGMFNDSTARGQRAYLTPMYMSAGVPITGAVSISTSGQWFCFSKADGTAYCQGYNGYANLGNGTVTSTPSSYPTQIKINANTNLTGVLTVSGGNYGGGDGSTCALASDGTTVGASLYCWGKNSTGWVGDGTTLQKNYATLVTINGSTTGVSSVATGSNHTCAVASGAAYCWGAPSNGQLGNNTTSGNVLSPTAVLATTGGVVFSSGVTQISVDSGGSGSTCILKNTGAVYCAGSNTSWQLNQGNNTSQILKFSPTIDFTSGITNISMGIYQMCAFNATAGTLMCAGDGGYGSLGTGTTTSAQAHAVTINQVTGLIGNNSKAPSSTISSIKGNSNPGDTLTDGSAWLGFPQPTLTYQWYKCPSAVVTSTSIPAGCNQISGETSATYTVQASDIGSYVSLRVTATSDSNVVNRILSQPNPVGQLPSMTSSPTISLPVNSAGMMVGLTATAAEGTWSGANPTGATAFQWYRCGNSGSATTTMPADCAEIYGATAATYTSTQSESGFYIRAGQKYTSTAGAIVALSDTSAQVRAANAISSNNNNTCAIRYGKVYCWGPAGSNYNGDNVSLVKSINIAPTPVKQADGSYLTDVIQIATGGSHACAIKVNGTLWCWGQYSNGTAGLGTASGTIAATQITTSNPTQSSYNKWLQVAISNTSETCAIDTDGAIWCSGIAGYGFAGDNYTTNMSVFKKSTNASLTSGVIQITGSPFNTQFCAVKNTGTVYCWGQNQYGNVGDGQTASVKTAIVPLNMESGVTNVQFAGGSTCAIKNGAIWCWGLNDTQQFGMDTAQTANMYYTPIQLPALSGAADPTRGVTSIALTQNGVTNSQVCFVNYLGAAACSGANTFGQQNRADILSNTTFQPTRWTSGVSAISITGDDSKGIVTCAVVNNGVYCAGAPAAPSAGRNGNLGQRGVGDINPYVVAAGPTSALGLSDGVGILDKAPYAIQLSTTQNFSPGQTVTSSATWEAYPAGSAAYQWYSCLFPGATTNTVPADCSTISGANSSTYSVVAGDSGNYLRLAITVTNNSGTALSLTTAAQVGDAPSATTPTGLVTISTPRLMTGTVLTAPGMPVFSGTPTPANSTNWYHCTSSSSAWVSTLPAGCYPADGGTGSTYTATHSDDGFYIMVGYTSTNSAGSLSFFSPTTASRTQFVNKLAMSGDGGACLIRSGKVYCWGMQTAGGALGSPTVVGTNGLVLGTLAGYITKAPTVPVALANGLALTNVVSITMGKAHTCAITYSGALYCWGYNATGQLGDGTTVSRYTAAPVLSAAGAALTGVTQVAASYDNTCAVVNGSAICWGGTAVVSPAKSYATGAVTGLSTDVQQIAMGVNHACAVANAALRCWGNAGNAGLGDGATSGTVYAPAASISAIINGKTVTLSNGVTNLALGNGSTCAILLGKVYCWGYGTAPGNLGVPYTDQVNFLPAPPTGDGTANFDSGVVQVVGGVAGGVGYNSLFCAIKTNQAAYCGYASNSGGAGNATVSPMTQLATNLSSGVTDMAIAGPPSSCAIKGSSLLCAGRGVSYLFLNTTTTDVVLHTAIPISVANAGFNEQAPVAGTATISGYTAVGNVLTSTPSNYETSGAWQGSPTPSMDTQWYVCDSSGSASSSLPSDCSAISAATTSTLTVAADQLGKYLRTGITATNSLGTVTGYSAAYGPVGTPPALSSAAGVGTGNSPVLNSTTTITGTAGSFDSGTTANQWYRCSASGATAATSTPSGCVAIPSATSTTYALSRSDIGGYLRFASIATNASGQSFTFSPTSTQVVEGSMIATGLNVTCAVKLGRVYCWGKNLYYTLGTGDISTSTQVISSNLATTPVKINASTILEDVADIQAYGKTVCAVTTAGALYCWGQDPNGELGRGAAINTYSAFAGTPSAATDGAVFTSGVMGVTVGIYNVCAWKTSGVAYCWGYNATGQLGNGSTTTTYAYSPMPVSTITNVTKISLGNSHACAVAGGAVYCWGQNTSGAVIEGTTTGTQLTPVARTILTSGVTDVSSSGAVSCALMNYSVYCFGSNTTGALGADGYLPLGYTFNIGAFPLTGPMSSGVTSLWGAHGAGNPTCANKGDGTFYCWGNDSFGELPGILIPTTFAGALMGPTLSTLSSVTTFAHSANTSSPAACYVAAGISGCSGYGNDYQLGNGLTANVVGTTSSPPAVFKPSTFNSLLGADYVAPVITNTPAITGSTFSSGQSLTANTPTGYGFPTPVLTQKWVGCSAAGTASSATPIDCSDISGATGTSYTLQNSDAGSRIRLAFVATNSVATAYSYTATSATPVAAAKANQTITFTGSVKQLPAGNFELSGTTTSGLPITYTSTTLSVCTVSGSTVTPLTLGTCTITASQAGDASYNAATSVNASFTIESVPVQTAAVAIVSATNYRFGTALTATAGTWTGNATITYARAWYRCDTAPSISAATGTAAALVPSDCVSASATGLSYTPVVADVGKFLAYAETATNTTSTGTNNRTTFAVTSTAVEKQTQAITFAALTGVTYGNAAFTLTATTDRSLTVTFTSSDTSVCTISGTTLTIVGGGSCDVTASQSGNATIAAATDVVRTLNVAKSNQTISFTGSAKQISGGDFALAATTTSGLAITYTSTTASVCTVSGSTVTPLALGTCTVAAAQAGNNSYNAATTVNASFDIQSRPVQTNPVSIASAANYRFGVPIVGTPGTWTGNPTVSLGYGWLRCDSAITGVSDAAGNGGSNIPAGCAFITGAISTSYTPALADVGKYLAIAEIAGNSPAGGLQQRTTIVPVASVIEKQTQAITFAALTVITFGDAAVTLTATSDRSKTITYASSNTSVCTISGSTLTIVGGGSCDVTASQAGDSSTLAATSVTQTLTVNKKSQTVTLPDFTAGVYLGANKASGATASSGLTVTLTTNDSAICSVSGLNVVQIAAGDCTVTASQAGNGNYLAATPVSKTLTIAKATQTITLPAFTGGTYGDSAKASGATTTSGLTLTLVSADTAICTVSGLNVNIVAPGACSITASQAGNSNYLAATDVTKTFTIAKAAQTITFTGSTKQKPAGDFALAATTTSGLAISYTSTTPAVCSVAGSTVTPVTLGTCTVTSAQAGDSNYLAATSVNASFTIESVPVQTAAVSIPSAANYRFGVAVTAAAGTWTGTSAITYARAWFRCDTAASVSAGTGSATALKPADCTAISGATALSYTPVAADIGKYLAIAETASNTTSTGANSRTTFVSTATAVEKQTQAITFATIANKTYGDAAFAIGATSDRSLTITYASSDTTVCTISGSNLTVLKPGTCDVTASQAGDATTLAATDVVRTLTVVKANQTISLNNLTAITYRGTPTALVYSATSGLTVSVVSNDTAVCTVSGTTVSVVAVGTCSITASQAGNSNWNAATSVTKTFVISQHQDTLTFTGATKQFRAGNFNLTSSTLSGVSVSYASTTPSICTVAGSTVTPLTHGTCSITATAATNSNYIAPAAVSANFTIERAVEQSVAHSMTSYATYWFDQAITYTAGTWVGSGTVTVSRNWHSCTSAPTANVVSGTTVPGGCTLVTETSAGVYKPVASDIGKYIAIAETASNVANATTNTSTSWIVSSGVVTKLAQTITFAALADKTYGNVPFVLTGSSDRSLTISYASSDTSVCTVSGSTVSIVAAGTCDITAAQTGNATVAAANSVSRTLTVNKAAQTVSLASFSNVTYSSATVSATFSSTSGLAVAATSNDTAVCTISGATISLVASGTCSITAAQAGNANYLAATSVTKTFQIAKANQTVTFTIDDFISLGEAAALDLNGTTTSGLAVTYTVSDAAVCKVQNGTLVGLAPGLCTVTAAQVGDDRYNTDSVSRTLQVGSYAVVTSMTPIGSVITNATTTGFTVTFDSAITGFTAADLTTVPAGKCDIGEPAAVNGNPAVYSVALTNCSEGSVVLKVAALSISNGAPGPMADAVGEEPIVIDRTFLQTTTVVPQFTSPTNDTSLVYNVTFAEDVSGFTTSDVSFTGNGSTDCVASISGSGASYVVTVTGCADGTVKLVVAAGSVDDLAGNGGPTLAKQSAEATVDLVAPVAPEASGLPETYTRSTSVTVAFATDSANTYHCTLNGVELTGCDGTLDIPASSLTAGDYTVEVWATDAAGNDSTHNSHTFTIGNYARPAAPVINAAAFERTAFNHLTINWSLAAAQSSQLPVTGLTLEYSTNGTTWTAVETLAADATSYDLTMQSGSTYAFRIRALSGPFAANASDNSATASYIAIYKPIVTAQSTSAALLKPAAGTSITLTGTDLRDFANATTGTVVTLTDSANKSFVATVTVVTPTSVRFTVPTTSKIGNATVKVTVGSGIYQTASATRTIRIVAAKVAQVITFNAPAATRVGDADTQLVATMDSLITPTFQIEPGSIGICTVSATGLLHPIKGGVCSYKVLAVAGDAFSSFTSTAYNTTVNKLDVAIAFELPADLTSAFNQAGKLLLNPTIYQLTAVADVAIPNTKVSVTSTPETVCFVDGELKLHVISIGTCTITALAENDFYRTQIPVTRVFEVVKSVQTLTYIAPGTTQGSISAPQATDSISGFQMIATLDSGMTPTFEVTDSNICTVDPSGMVSWVSDLVKSPNDVCEIKISHPGDANYYPVEPVVVRFGGTHVAPLPPVGGYVREPDGALAVGRTGGLAASGNEGVAVVVVTGSKIAITPFSRGIYIGPISATVTIPYYIRVKNVLTYKEQLCTIKWGILKKYKAGDPKAFKVKDFPNKVACNVNKDAIAWFKTGARLLPTIVVKRDRKWPTTYLAKAGSNGKGAKIWPRIKTWHLTIG